MHLKLLPPACSNAAELERLGDEIAELAAHVHAATYTLLVRLLEFDRREGWGHGFRNCAHWLSWRTGIAPGAAREKVRVARALEQLPQLSESMRRGEFSFAKVRAITRVATPQNESALVEVARHATAAHMEKIVRAWRRVDRLEEQREESARHDARYLTLRIDEDGRYELRGSLDPEVGALLEKALEAAVETLYGRERVPAADLGGERTAAEQRRADAIGLIAECALRSGMSSGCDGAATMGRADRYQVVLHMDREALRSNSDTGQSLFANGARVSAETSRRLSCDASLVVMSSDPHATPHHTERRTRTVPAAIRRALDYRDRGCRFPGCTSRFCDAHHVVHWADGGA